MVTHDEELSVAVVGLLAKVGLEGATTTLEADERPTSRRQVTLDPDLSAHDGHAARYETLLEACPDLGSVNRWIAGAVG